MILKVVTHKTSLNPESKSSVSKETLAIEAFDLLEKFKKKQSEMTDNQDETKQEGDMKDVYLRRIHQAELEDMADTARQICEEVLEGWEE